MHINDVLVLQNNIIISLLRIIAENSMGEDGGFTDIFENKIEKAHKLAENWRSTE